MSRPGASGRGQYGGLLSNSGGTLRDFLNAILAFIGATSLTDGEYNSIDQTDLAVSTYNAACYLALSSVLIDREAVSTTQDRLRYFFMSKGVQVSEVSKAKSNVLVGFDLC